MSFYLIDQFEQGSSEWHSWRRGVIGASDAGSILGENRFKSRAYLMKEKLGQVAEFRGNDKTREGQQLEGVARDALSEKFNLSLKPIIAQHAGVPYFAASLDAISSDYKQVFEIKAGQKTYEHALASHEVPGYYVAQIQHILMVTHRESMIFAAYRPNQPLFTTIVNRDDSYIDNLQRSAKSFIEELSERGHQVQYEFRGRLVD